AGLVLTSRRERSRCHGVGGSQRWPRATPFSDATAPPRSIAFETNSLVSSSHHGAVDPAGSPAQLTSGLGWRRPDQQLGDYRGGPAAEFLATEAGHRRIHQHVSRDREADDERTHQPDALDRVVGGGGDPFGRYLLG